MLDQTRSDYRFARDLLALFEHQQHAIVGLGRTESVNAAHAGDNDAIAPLEERFSSGEPELIELVVGGGFFFDVDVARRECRLRAGSNRNS